MKKYVLIINMMIFFLSGCARGNEYKLKYVPEIGFNDRVMTVNRNYAYWEGTLLFNESIYKLDNGIYKKEDSIYSLFEMPIYKDIKQYNNLVIAMAEDMDKFLVYDMNSQTEYVYDIYGQENHLLYTWYVYNGKIYYMVESDINILDRQLVCMDVATGDNKQIYFPTQNERGESLLLSGFAIREDGAVMAEVYNRDTKETEYRRISIEEEGEVSEKKLWATDQYLYAYDLQYNEYGFFLLGEFPNAQNEKTEVVCIKDNGDVQKVNILSIFGLIMTDTGYFLCGNSENEHRIDDVSDLFSNKIDSIFFYNFDGEIVKRYYLDCEEYYEEGYQMETIIDTGSEMMVVYLNDNEGIKISKFLK